MSDILIVLTSHDRLGDTGKKTGFHFEEMSTPYWAFRDAGHHVVLASIKGGKAPVDPGSLDEKEEDRPASVNRFLKDSQAMAVLGATTPIASVNPEEFDAVFLPGGHGTMWDFPGNPHLAKIIGAIYAQGGVVAAVCHGPAGLVDVLGATGRPLVEGKRINSFTNAEEKEVGADKIVPFLLETRLQELGANFEPGQNFKEKVVQDGRLITGQNPASAKTIADRILDSVKEAA